jgi:hypothetical protein
MWGSGALSAGTASGGTGVDAVDADFSVALAVAPAEVPLVQATVLARTMASSTRQIFNHRGHKGTQGKAWLRPILVARLFMDSLCPL